MSLSCLSTSVNTLLFFLMQVGTSFMGFYWLVLNNILVIAASFLFFYLLRCIDDADVVPKLQRSQDGSEDWENKGSSHCLEKKHTQTQTSTSTINCIQLWSWWENHPIRPQAPVSPVTGDLGEMRSSPLAKCVYIWETFHTVTGSLVS